MAGLTILFFLALAVQSVFPRLCALCAAVLTTWVLGLLLYHFEVIAGVVDPVVVALFMGGSVVGLLYYLRSVVPERLLVFQLPYLLTAFALLHFALSTQLDLYVLAGVLLVWVLFGFVFILQDSRSRAWFKKIVECCRDW